MIEVERKAISARQAPDPVGFYSQAIRSGEFLFCSGQIAIDPETGSLVGSSAAEQAGQCLRNLAAVCLASESRLEDAVRVTIFLTDAADFAPVNAIYERYFATPPPSRCSVVVAGLPMDALVEIDAVIAVASLDGSGSV